MNIMQTEALNQLKWKRATHRQRPVRLHLSLKPPMPATIFAPNVVLATAAVIFVQTVELP